MNFCYGCCLKVRKKCPNHSWGKNSKWNSARFLKQNKTKQKLVLKREKDPEKVVKEAPRSVSSNVGICGLQQDCVQGSGSQVISPTNASPLTEEGL